MNITMKAPFNIYHATSISISVYLDETTHAAHFILETSLKRSEDIRDILWTSLNSIFTIDDYLKITKKFMNKFH